MCAWLCGRNARLVAARQKAVTTNLIALNDVKLIQLSGEDLGPHFEMKRYWLCRAVTSCPQSEELCTNLHG